MGTCEEIISDRTIPLVFLTQPVQFSALGREKWKYLFDVGVAISHCVGTLGTLLQG